MRYSEHDLYTMAFLVTEPTMQGRLQYKGVQQGKLRNVRELQGQNYRERAFKLKGNLFFYYRINEDSNKHSLEPIGALLLERFSVRREMNADKEFLFSIAFHDDRERKHYFLASNGQLCDQWVQAIRNASYEQLKATWMMLHNKIKRLRDMTQESKLNEQQKLHQQAPTRPARAPSPRPNQPPPRPNQPPAMFKATQRPVMQGPLIPEVPVQPKRSAPPPPTARSTTPQPTEGLLLDFS